MKEQNSPVRFAVVFVIFFLLFYYFNIWLFSVTNPGKHYIDFLAVHLNYIQWLRSFLLWITSGILKAIGFAAIYNDYEILVAGHGIIRIVYSCLGLGVLSFFAAFIIAYPKPLKTKVVTLAAGSLIIESLNVVRFILLALFGNKQVNQIIDHHTLFNIIMYLIISVSLYFWIKHDLTVNH